MLDTVSDSWHRNAEFKARPAGVVLAEERVSLLTERQKDVMRMLAEGMINKQIAHRLDISVATVKTHIASAVRRMKAKNRIHAVAMLIRAESLA
ncbi:helix-turn-helix domain-containing protein [Microvirga tunisiensis]|uniref:Helix-turn-helix domain-containing protein n=2 Tax=Pannonibacter tanglangensis TaxID=2750084 RepID=A0A7X5JAJ2_9HYPH|nr:MULTISPECIES: LuxR C-terminal-related transcriptional regulator [unclassified Pannonibacter]NBN64961.1 helix-turn-helix domain-containing protein [Pannonibacter sp. XCT-34]NBN79470.1 helix-turn-helix domain-containing protein [Pannonibacter sp. XCT-53]